MALSHSPKIVTDGLVFAYDMANAQKSWKGAPTVNLITNPHNLSSNRTAPASCGSSFTDFTTGGPTDGPFVRITRVTTSPSSDWPFEIYYPSIAIGTTFKFSCFARSINGSVSTIEFANPDAEEVSFALTPQWQRFSTTFTSGVQSNLQFMRINRSNGNDKTIGSIYDVADAQIEVQSVVTPFVNGTRSNTQAIVDLTNNNTITATSLTYNSDGSFNFIGANSNYLTIGTTNDTALKGTAAYTVMGWINCSTSGPNGYSEFYMANSGGLTSSCINIFWYNNTIGFFTGTGSFYSYQIAVGTLSYNTWYHVTAVIDYTNSLFSVYLNGIYKGQSSFTTYTPAGTTVTIGKNNCTGNAGDYTTGRIPMLSVYNRALSDTEVKQNFNALRGRYGL